MSLDPTISTSLIHSSHENSSFIDYKTEETQPCQAVNNPQLPCNCNNVVSHSNNGSHNQHQTLLTLNSDETISVNGVTIGRLAPVIGPSMQQHNQNNPRGVTEENRSQYVIENKRLEPVGSQTVNILKCIQRSIVADIKGTLYIFNASNQFKEIDFENNQLMNKLEGTNLPFNNNMGGIAYVKLGMTSGFTIGNAEMEGKLFVFREQENLSLNHPFSCFVSFIKSKIQQIRNCNLTYIDLWHTPVANDKKYGDKYLLKPFLISKVINEVNRIISGDACIISGNTITTIYVSFTSNDGSTLENTIILPTNSAIIIPKCLVKCISIGVKEIGPIPSNGQTRFCVCYDVYNKPKSMVKMQYQT